MLAEHAGERLLVEQIRLHELEPVADGGEVRVRILRRGPHDPDDVVAALEQQLGEVRAVLAARSR